MLNLPSPECEQHLAKVRETADKMGAEWRAKLEKQLEYLGSFSDDPSRTRCDLYPDFAPLSFYFNMMIKGADGEFKRWFNGGLIFHGPHDNGGDGGAPSFSVSIQPHHGWSVHT